jgi:hypothetical protein
MKYLKAVSIVLLLVVGSGAMYGGTQLMIDPSGKAIEMPFHWIRNTPFRDYFLPGLILFISNGLLSMATAASALIGYRHYIGHIFVQGSVYVGWIIIQMMLLQVIFWLQLLIAGIGLLLMLFAGIQNIILEERSDHL